LRNAFCMAGEISLIWGGERASSAAWNMKSGSNRRADGCYGRREFHCIDF
jgi:hypothetical protein